MPPDGATPNFPGIARPRLLRAEVWVPRPLEEVFAFFADAFNLNALTPPWLNFRIVTRPPIRMRVGAVIDYRIGLRGIPMRWRTEITAFDPPNGFVDVQVRGPYTLWHHRHWFRADRGGTLAGDEVHYALPFNSTWATEVLHRAVVRPDLDRIFAYRREKMLEIFGGPKPGARAGV